MKIAENAVATIEYTLTDSQGTVLDQGLGDAAFAYLHGHGNIIPGLEKALVGKAEGDALTVTVEPAMGYGIPDEKLIQKVPVKAFQGVPSVEVGMRFQVRGPQGMQVVRVIAVEGEEVTIDANHELAGVTLNFDVKVKSVRQATADELSHGHAHGAGGHHHH
ncbi:MAG: peptidylprolyl isomerase [Verrucomicrobiota bacterium]|nr:peptidylprolyl isomerase [Verrucomicrobiota bacterium]